MDKLQHVLNAAACVVTGTRKFDCNCVTNFTGSIYSTGCFSSWQWQFIGVWMATCLSDYCVPAASADSSICVLLTINYSQYRVSGSTLMDVGPFQLLAAWSGALSQILSWIQWSV